MGEPHLGEPSTPHVVRGMACSLGGKANKIQTPPHISTTTMLMLHGNSVVLIACKRGGKGISKRSYMSWSELNTSLTWQCTVPAKFCLLDPIAPLPTLHLRGVWDISTLVTAEHKQTWVALKDVVSEGEEAQKRTARTKAPTQALPRPPIYAQPRMTRGMVMREREILNGTDNPPGPQFHTHIIYKRSRGGSH